MPAPRSSSPNEIEQPDWLNSEFIQEIRPSAKEVHFKKCSSVVEVGDNYLAKMYRVDLDLKGDEGTVSESFVIKSLENIDAMMKSFGIFDTEKELYVDVLPEFARIWSDIGKPTEFAPKCFKAAEKPHDLMVLEDLNASGYKMANRFEKLDLEHAMITLAKLAKFHATSLVFSQKVSKYYFIVF